MLQLGIRKDAKTIWYQNSKKKTLCLLIGEHVNKTTKEKKKKKKVCCVVFVYHIFTEASRKTPSKVTLLK